MATGSAFIGAGFLAAERGNVTGNYEGNQWTRMPWPRNSIRPPFSDTWIRHDFIPFGGFALTMGADIATAVHAAETSDERELASGLALAAARAVGMYMEEHPIAGLNDIVDVAFNSVQDPESAFRNLQRLGGNIASTVVPLHGARRDLVKLLYGGIGAERRPGGRPDEPERVLGRGVQRVVDGDHAGGLPRVPGTRRPVPEAGPVRRTDRGAGLRPRGLAG